MFYAELRSSGYRLTLGTYPTVKLATRAYDPAAWRFRCPRRDMNFPDVESLKEAEFLTSPPPLLTDTIVPTTARSSASSPSPSAMSA
jgi:hypothetical protein